MKPARRIAPWAMALVLAGSITQPLRAGEPEWRMWFDQGKLLLEQSDYQKARDAFEKAEKEASTSLAMTDPRAIETLRMLAESNRLLDRVAVAEDLQKQVLGVLTMDLGAEDPATVAQYGEMGKFYTTTENFAKAREFYGKAYDAQKKKPEAYPDWPLVAHEYSIALFRMKEFKLADEVLGYALGEAEKLRGAESLAMAVLLRDRGEVKVALQDDSSAEGCFTRSIDLFIKLGKAGDPSIAAMQTRLAEIAGRRDKDRKKADAVAAAQEERTRQDATSAAAAAVDQNWEMFAPPPGWRTLKVYHGIEPRTTEVFRISGAHWRLLWNTYATSDPKFSSLGITVFKEGDTLGMAHLDVEGSAHNQAEYEGPGSFYVRMNTANVTYQVAIQESAEASTADSSAPVEAPKAASVDQKAFEDTITSYSIRYRNATSDLGRSSLRAKRAHDLVALLPESRAIVDWTGVIKTRGFTPEGAGFVAIQLDGTRKVTVATQTDAAADTAAKSLIAKDSPLSQALGLLKEGDRVKVRGVLVMDEGGPDSIDELSDNELKAMIDPTFLVRLTAIQRIP